MEQYTCGCGGGPKLTEGMRGAGRTGMEGKIVIVQIPVVIEVYED
jgi:hypothetical protein